MGPVLFAGGGPCRRAMWLANMSVLNLSLLTALLLVIFAKCNGQSLRCTNYTARINSRCTSTRVLDDSIAENEMDKAKRWQMKCRVQEGFIECLQRDKDNPMLRNCGQEFSSWYSTVIVNAQEHYSYECSAGTFWTSAGLLFISCLLQLFLWHHTSSSFPLTYVAYHFPTGRTCIYCIKQHGKCIIKRLPSSFTYLSSNWTFVFSYA